MIQFHQRQDVFAYRVLVQQAGSKQENQGGMKVARVDDPFHMHSHSDSENFGETPKPSQEKPEP